MGGAKGLVGTRRTSLDPPLHYLPGNSNTWASYNMLTDITLKQYKLDGCIVWNAHNTVIGSKCLAICALAVYFAHSTRPNSLPGWESEWLILGSCVVRCRQPSPDVAENLAEVSCTECTGHGSDFELIPTVKMETRLPPEGLFGNKFPSTYNHCGVMAAWSHKTLKKL